MGDRSTVTEQRSGATGLHRFGDTGSRGFDFPQEYAKARDVGCAGEDEADEDVAGRERFG